MNDAKTAILEWQNKQLSGTQLMRQLVGYATWNLPVSAAAARDILNTNSLSKIQFNEAPDGSKRLLLYTDSASFSEGLAAMNTPSPEQHFLTTTGAWIFQMPLQDFAAILINPGTPTSIVYVGAQLDRLRKMAAAVAVEEQIAKLRAGVATDESVRKAAEYSDFCLAVRKVEDRTVLSYAPDSQQRKLIAVFTSDDSFDAYLEVLPEELGEVTMQLKLPGRELFALLQNQDAVGLVFNCKGPGKPAAFALAVCAVFLGELAA